MQFLVLKNEAHKLLYLFSLSKYLVEFNFVEVFFADFLFLLILLGFLKEKVHPNFFAQSYGVLWDDFCVEITPLL